MNTLKIIFLSFVIVLASIVTVKAQTDLSKPVNNMITKYLALKDALANSDGASAETKASGLLVAFGEIPKLGLTADEAALLPKLEFDSRHISEVNKIAHQREHFASLSNNLYTFVKKVKLNNIVLYREYCTMTKTYYLSAANKGKDPYMGMANCSKVTETLLPANK
jgi:hypothetical protein